MDNITMSLGIYFEVKDAEIYGGEGTVGYAATIFHSADYRRLISRNTQRARRKAWRSSATSRLKR
jgi:hypothetical protein